MDIKQLLIDNIGLSVRSINALHRADVYTVGDMLNHTEESLSGIRNLGKKSIDEILQKIEEIRSAPQDFCTSITTPTEDLSTAIPPSLRPLLNEVESRESILSYVKSNDIAILDLGLSARPKNRLLSCGHTMLSGIIFITRQDLQQMPSMGASSVDEILNKIHDYLTAHEQAITAFCQGDRSVLWSEDKLRTMILDMYKSIGFGGLSLEEMWDRLQLPADFEQSKLKKVIGRLLADHELEYVDFRCYRVYEKFSDYLKTCSAVNDRSRDILQKRLLGHTLEEIAREYDLTRERVRQIIKRDAEKVRTQYKSDTGMPHFDEDYYRYLYETYGFDKKDGAQWLGIPPYVFCYFEVSDIKNGQQDLLSALEDRSLDVGLRLKIKNYLNRNKIYLDGIWVEKKRAELEEYVVRTFCTTDVSFDAFIQIYNDFLVQEDVAYDEDLYYTQTVLRSRKNHLAEARFLLWKQNEMIRFYDIDGQDFTELLDTLNLGAFENIELSTVKFMENYPEIMEKYDIRNQYELHNLLRKIVPEGSYHDFHCGRMPEIKFGTFDRGSALLDLLIDNAPISAVDFAELIHKEYGYDRTVILSTYLLPLSQYYHQGIYSIDQKTMPFPRKQLLQSSLTEDFYYIDEIRKIYTSLFPDANAEEVNPYTLKTMGFVVLSRYALQHYPSLDAYFKEILTRDDVVDITSYRRKFVYVQMFTQTFTELKQSRNIIEFEPNQIINIRKLERSGITRDMLQAFCDQVYDFIEDGTYFSAQSLRKSGFESELYDLGFSDWFYANILAVDDRFSSARMYSTVILYKGTRNISIKSFQVDLVQAHGCIDIYDLMTELTDVYGCRPDDKYDVVYKLQGTAVYYDRILDRLYASADAYYQDLDNTEGI